MSYNSIEHNIDYLLITKPKLNFTELQFNHSPFTYSHNKIEKRIEKVITLITISLVQQDRAGESWRLITKQLYWGISSKNVDQNKIC